MKGVILAGGLGTRMRPLTITTNKHLLPVYDKQMIIFPIETLVKSGIKNILIVSDKQFINDFSKLLGSGSDFGINLSYQTQNNPKGGIADALMVSKDFAGEDSIAVILGDNIFEDNLNLEIKQGKSAKVFLKKVDNKKDFGIAEIKNGELVNILEKPNIPPSDFAVLGAYVYPPSVFSIIGNIKPSARGELEITDVNNYYANKGELDYQEVKNFWADAGTFEGLFESSVWRREQHQKNKDII